MSEINFRDFSGGWCPGDDPVNGRKNALLQMDNCVLDSNGALTLAGGTSVKQSGFPANAHTLFSRLINGARHDYSALADGSIYRDSTSIATGGDSTNAAFGTAFNFTLIASGNKRVKDSGAGTPVNLGILPPTLAPGLSLVAIDAPLVVAADMLHYTVTPVGSSAVVGSYLQITANGSGNAVVQTYNDPSDPIDTTILVSPATSSHSTDNDTIIFTGYTPSPIGKKLQIALLLAAGNNAGDLVSDYYAVGADLGLATFDPTIGTFTLTFKRSDFIRVGTGSQTWNAIYGTRITYEGAPGDVINLLGGPIAGQIIFIGGDKAQNGIYQYMQVNVNNTGSYLAKSTLGPVSAPITVVNNQVFITCQDPSSIDAQCNEAWIYRIGGLLGTWYRVKVITSFFATPKQDTLSDLDALALNIKYDTNLVSIASSSITDKIYDIVGPVNGRWYYFTEQFMYPSDINDPDLVNPSLGVRICGSSSELLMWARKLNDSTIRVGTSLDMYDLSGTFQTFPDGTIDVYYRSINCKYPPLTCDADVFGGIIYYLSNDGWRISAAGGENTSLVSPNLDRLYRGETVSGYAPPNLKVLPRSARFPIVIAKNKMWCVITGLGINSRIEVYDFIRQYWRPLKYGLGDISAITLTPDGQVLAFFTTDKKLREIDISSSKLIDGATKQSILIRSVVFDGGQPLNRKDTATLKVKSYNTDTLNVSLIIDTSVATNSVANVASNALVLESFYDLSQINAVALVKTYQFVVGAGTAVADFILDYLNIVYDSRPEQRSFFRFLNTNFGTAARKRLRSWPAIIDTLGNTVVFTPINDNASGSPTNLSSSNKTTLPVYYTTDVQAVDYGFTLLCTNGLFEFFEMGQPDIVQTFPITKRFDQVGPDELFRFGKIKQIEFRLLPFGTSIPYTIYFNDAPKQTGTLTVVPNVDASYFIMMPKGISGNVVRIELGPTNFDYIRFYARIQVAASGKDTELDWINL